MPFQRKYLLTPSEQGFYKWLAPIAEKYNQGIFSKVTVGDIVRLNSTDADAIEIYNKAKNEKVDFALYNKSNAYITCIIQCHNTKENQNSEAIERLCICAGYTYIPHQNYEFTEEILRDKFKPTGIHRLFK
ncbi:MAG: DUF2726 domain-containing protein [Clostridia bacterium]|nr:DUF2726 domain-containing protein [Clostridia bacterium]